MTNLDTPRSKWHRITYLLPLIAPLVVVVTFVIFYAQFLFCAPESPCNPLSSAELLAGLSSVVQTRVAAYVARSSWAVANGVHVIACLVAIVTASLVMYHALSEYDTKVRWMIILIVVVLAADIALAIALWASIDVSSPGQELLRNTVGHVLPEINKYNRYSDALSLTGTLSLAAAACATLWHRDMKNELDETQLVRRVNLLRPVLYVGAATLAIAVLRLSATFGWAASYLPPESDLGKAVTSLVAGIVGSLGTSYTLLMAGVYLPAALLLRARVKAFSATQPDPQAWLVKRGLTLSFPQYLPRVIALLTPLLAGPLGDLLVRTTAALGGSV
jgi:hypothetical protein